MSCPNLAELLGAFDAAGVSFQRSGDGLLLTPANRVTPELAALTRDNKERLMTIAWLDRSPYGPLRPLPPPVWATHAFVSAEGSMELRKHMARIATERQEQEAVVALGEALRLRTAAVRDDMETPLGTGTQSLQPADDEDGADGAA